MFGNISGNHLKLLLQNASKSSLLVPFTSIDNEVDVKALISQYLSTVVNKEKLDVKRNELMYRYQVVNTSLISNVDSQNIDELVENDTTLKCIGQQNEIKRIQSELDQLEVKLSKEVVNSSQILSLIGKSNGLVSALNKGKVENTTSWLLSRSLGLTGFKQPVRRGLSHNIGNSASSVARQLMTSYMIQWTISGHMLNPAYCVVFDKTGEYLITGADDLLLKIWNVKKGLLVHTLKGHQGYISLIEVSPDNSMVASSCTQGMIRLWNLFDGRCLKVLNHGSAVNWIKFDLFTGSLASVGEDGNCIVWDIAKIIYDQSVAYSSDENFQSNSSLINILIAEDQGIENNFSHTISKPMTLPSATIVTVDADIISHDALSTPPRITYGMSRNTSNFKGLFAWSRDSKDNDQYAVLVLTHLPESLQLNGLTTTSPTEDAIKVNCLDISPLGDILITGCEDGIARVWRFADVDEQERQLRSLQPAIGDNMSLNSLRDLLSPFDFRRMQAISNHLLQRLEGHVSSITDIRFSNLGDRIVTGSLDDGTIRIWSFNRNYTRNEHIFLSLKDDEIISASNTSIASNAASHNGPARRTSSSSRKQNKTELFNVAWTCDDTRVITLQSIPIANNNNISLASVSNSKETSLPTRLKVWDSFTGDLLRVVPIVSELSCKLLATHPTNPLIVLTSGVDGYVRLWNIEYECLLNKHYVNDSRTINSIDMQANHISNPAHLVDVSFSPDGHYIAITDIIGRLTLLGLEKNSEFNMRNTCYYDQYFSTDYADFILDDDFNAIDLGTQLPMHEAPR